MVPGLINLRTQNEGGKRGPPQEKTNPRVGNTKNHDKSSWEGDGTKEKGQITARIKGNKPPRKKEGRGPRHLKQ